MANLSLTTYTNVLKDVYEAGIAEVLNHSHYTMDIFEKDTESIDFAGKQAVIPVEYGDNEGYGARSIATKPALPTPGVPLWTQSKTPIRFVVGSIGVDEPTMLASERDKGAFAKAMDTAIRNLKNGMYRDCNRMIHSDGSGLLCLCDTTSGATKIELPVYPGVKWIRNTMLVDIRTLTTGVAVANGDSVAVSGRDDSLIDPHFDVPAVVTAAVTEGVYREDAMNVEPMGLRGIINRSDPPAGYLQGIQRSVYEAWQAYVFDNPQGTGGTDRALTGRLMAQAVDKVEMEKGGHVDVIATTPALLRNYVFNVCPNRFAETMKLDAGWEGLKYTHGHPIVIMADPDCYKGHMYFIDKTTFRWYVMADWHWLARDGSVLKWEAGYANFMAYFEKYYELGCKNPSKNTVIKDLDETEI